MFGVTGDEDDRFADGPSASGDDACRPAPAGLRAWLACTLLHRRAHRWYPRYLGGYDCCPACGREWE